MDSGVCVNKSAEKPTYRMYMNLWSRNTKHRIGKKIQRSFLMKCKYLNETKNSKQTNKTKEKTMKINNKMKQTKTNFEKKG